jgi:hypothetical protein
MSPGLTRDPNEAKRSSCYEMLVATNLHNYSIGILLFSFVLFALDATRTKKVKADPPTGGRPGHRARVSILRFAHM